MYAAAGGASLASRQKRKNQAAQNVKNKALLQQGLKDKLAATRASNLAQQAHKAQSRPFHNLPSTYLRAPQAHVRKLSAGYTVRNKILVPINESNNQYFAHFHPHIHSITPTPTPTTPHHHQHPHNIHDHPDSHASSTHEPHHQHHHHFHRISVTPRPISVHDPSCDAHHRLTKSATASIPLVSHYSEITPPDSPSCLLKPPTQSHIATIPAVTATAAVAVADATESFDFAAQQINVTPATPATSPGPPNTEQLERKCSFYRDRDKQFEFDDTLPKHEADYDDEYRVKHAVKPHHTTTTTSATVVERWTDSECCDSDHQNSICTCDHIECAQGRAAWLERGRRCSLSENAASCHRRWVKRNRIHDSTLSGSSDDDDFLGALRGPSSFANAFLYVGLGTVALGLVILFVGTGEKGFKTVELRLIGPLLIGIGLLCCMLRIFFCICPSSCISSKHRKLKKKNAKVDVDHTTSLLLCADNKRVQIARSDEPKSPDEAENFIKKTPNNKMNQGMETLRQLATTSLFIQSEKNNSSNHVPAVKIDTENVMIAPSPPQPLPNKEDKLEILSMSEDEEVEALVKLNSSDNCKFPSKHTEMTPYSIMDAAVKTSDTSFVLEPVREEQSRPNKLSRSRAPLNQSKSKESKVLLMSLDASPSSMNNNNNTSEVMSHRAFENGACASTMLSSIPSFNQSQSSSSSGSGSGSGSGRSMSGSSSNNKNDSNSLPLNRFDSIIRSTQDASTTRTASSMPVQSAVTSFASNVNNIEPELVLSPAKLGQ